MRVTTVDSYDLADRIEAVTLAGSRVVAYAYDANGNVTSITPPGQSGHTFEYTPVNLQAAYTPPEVEAQSPTVRSAYNHDRQLRQVFFPDDAITPAIAFGYETTTGRLATITTKVGTVTFGYDPARGRLASVTAPGCALTGCTPSGPITMAVQYDGDLLKQTAWTGPIAGTVGLGYDNNFRLTSTNVFIGANSYPISLGYDNDDLLITAGAMTVTRHQQTGLVTGTSIGLVTDPRSYDSFGEPTTYVASWNGGERFREEIPDPSGRDALGRIIERHESLNGNPVDIYTYTYDDAGRLWQVRTNGTLTGEYTYDGNGNRLTAPNLSGAVRYDAQDRLLGYGAISYSYTANGSLLTKAVGSAQTTYGYDALGNLRTVVLADGTALEYLIDGRNRRVGKLRNGALERSWVYENQLRPAAELDASGAVTARFVYGTRINVPEYVIKNPGTAQEATYRLVSNHLGSVRLAINVADGTVAQRLDYDEFGRVLTDTNPAFQPFGFAGGLYDKDTGLVRFGVRDYDAQVGRWVARDPAMFVDGATNLYLYALDDPVSNVDLTGLQSQKGNAINTIYNGATTVLGPVSSEIASTGGTFLTATGAGLHAYRDMAMVDFNFYKQALEATGEGAHAERGFEGVDWEKYGDSFDEAFANWLQKKPKPCGGGGQ